MTRLYLIGESIRRCLCSKRDD